MPCHKVRLLTILLTVALGLSAVACSGQDESDNKVSLAGAVSLMGKPIEGASISLWQTSAGNGAKQLHDVRSGGDGRFELDVPKQDGTVHYLIAQGGRVNEKPAEKLVMLSVLDPEIKESVVVNELTTVASVWPNAQLLDGHQLNGSTAALMIGSTHVRHMVDPETGHYGATLLDGFNLPSSETMARLNVLSNLLALCGSSTSKGCDQLLSLTETDNSLAAMTAIARAPWRNAGELYNLFTDSYPVDEAAQVRTSASQPYLLFAPESFSLSIRLFGGGALALGKMMFDDKANLWSGANWMPGSQSGVITGIGGGMTRFAPSGKPLSPALTGYNGQGLNGVGWGTGISEKYAWVSTFNNKIGVFDLSDGGSLGPATVDLPIGELQGIGTARNGDVWIADNTADHMIHFPGGDYTKGQRLTIKGLESPFGVAIDLQNRVWVSSSYDNKLTVFPAEAPDEVATVTIAVGARGLAIDSTGHVWVAQQSNAPVPVLAPGATLPPGAQFPPPKPKTIMQEFEAGAAFALANPQITTGGQVGVISPELKVVRNGIASDDVYVPWGVSIDGNDNVWVTSMLGQKLLHICGMNTAVCPKGKQTGDVINVYQSGVIQMTTDVIIDDAGNLWSANNWYDDRAVINATDSGRTSTFAGGQGFVVTYGVAGPVKNPLIGPVRRPE